MSEIETKEPLVSGERVERDEKGQFVEGHEKVGGRRKGSVSIIGAAKKRLKEDPELLGKIVEDLLGNDKLRLELIRQIDGMPRQKHKFSGEIKSELELSDSQFERLIKQLYRGGTEEDSGEEGGKGKTD